MIEARGSRRALLPLLLGAALLSTALVARAQPPPPSTATSSATARPTPQDKPPGPKPGRSIAQRLSLPKPHPGDALTVYVVTMGPGDHPFFKFGHDAIWIHDEKAEKKDLVYNYGTFEFESLTIIPRFFLGRFEYELSRRGSEKTFAEYRRDNRWVVAQKLDLTPEQRHELNEFLKHNYQEGNRAYRYHYFTDNCSTRVRDALDEVLDGRIAEAGRAAGGLTYRQHTLRLTASLPIEYVVVHLITSDYVDRPVTRWEEAFLPGELMTLLRDVTIIGPDGKPRPLVIEEKLVVESDRTPPLAHPPMWLGYFALTGTALGLLLVVAGLLGRRRRWARLLTAGVLAVLGVLCGLGGVLLVSLWVFTNHDAMWANENIWQFAPWLVATPAFVRGLGRGQLTPTRRAHWLTLSAMLASSLGLLLKTLPWFDQNNWQFIGFSLPAWLGAALATRWLLAAAARSDGQVEEATQSEAPEASAPMPAPDGEPAPAEAAPTSQPELSS